MTTDEKLAAILEAVQTDPGGRGLARDPHDNLFTATRGDFETACRSIVECVGPSLVFYTGFYIPTATPPAHETDGPLGCAFLMRAFHPLGYRVSTVSPRAVGKVIAGVLRGCGIETRSYDMYVDPPLPEPPLIVDAPDPDESANTYHISVEHVGRAGDGRYYSMRGRDITEFTYPHDVDTFLMNKAVTGDTYIGIGDGGNEIGMGKIPHETIVKNILNGDLIHCRVPTDHLIVAGVSNWGAYALAAGVCVLRGVKPPAELFDPDHEREILEVMVRKGPLVDGVTGKQTATVDGLTWDVYTRPFIRIREILES